MPTKRPASSTEVFNSLTNSASHNDYDSLAAPATSQSLQVLADTVSTNEAETPKHRGGRIAGKVNYNQKVLRECVREVLPTGLEGWKRVAQLYKIRSQEREEREPKVIKRQFLVKMCRASVGEPGQSRDLEECQHILKQIMDKEQSDDHYMADDQMHYDSQGLQDGYVDEDRHYPQPDQTVSFQTIGVEDTTIPLYSLENTPVLPPKKARLHSTITSTKIKSTDTTSSTLLVPHTTTATTTTEEAIHDLIKELKKYYKKQHKKEERLYQMVMNISTMVLNQQLQMNAIYNTLNTALPNFPISTAAAASSSSGFPNTTNTTTTSSSSSSSSQIHSKFPQTYGTNATLAHMAMLNSHDNAIEDNDDDDDDSSDSDDNM